MILKADYQLLILLGKFIIIFIGKVYKIYVCLLIGRWGRVCVMLN